MGCGASTSSVIEYAQVAPGLGGLGRRNSDPLGDEVVDFAMPILQTPVMDRMWAVRKQAMSTACIKEFMALLGLKTKDMQGAMRVFTRHTPDPGIPLEKLAAMLRLPSGDTSSPTSPLLAHFFIAVASTSADGASQGLTFRTFMFFHAIFKHAPLENAEKLRFWYNIMKLSNDSTCDLNESTTVGVTSRFLRDVVCSKCRYYTSKERLLY